MVWRDRYSLWRLEACIKLYLMLEILHAGLERNKKDFDQKIIIFQLQIFKKMGGHQKPWFESSIRIQQKAWDQFQSFATFPVPLVSLFSLPLKTENTNFRRGVKNEILERTLVLGTQKVKNMTYSSCVDLPKLTWSLRKNFQNKRNRRTSYKVKYDKKMILPRWDLVLKTRVHWSQ